MFVIRSKQDGRFAKRSGRWGHEWTDNIEKARVFRRIEDAKQSSIWHKISRPTSPVPAPKYNNWEQYQNDMKAWHKTLVYPDPKTFPIYIEPVMLVPVSLIPGVKKPW